MKKVSNEELTLDAQAYYDASGNISEAARARQLDRKTYSNRLRLVENQLGTSLGKVADGRIKSTVAECLQLPRRGHVRRFILTSLQNNTHLHPGFNNLLAYVDHLDNMAKATCEFMVGTFSYQKAAYGRKAVKRGTFKSADADPEWYAPEAEDYVADRMIQLAPGLMWNGHMNILPTNKHPLTDFETYNGRSSNIVPHATIAMESVASMADEAAKLNYSTGTIGQMNYIQKRAGILAEQRHTYGALLVEVNHGGSWWVRQLHIADDDAVYDIGPKGTTGCLRIQGGRVQSGDFVKGINWGDTHAAELERWVRELAWGKGGMLDQLRPKYQFMNDLFSMRSRGHHEMRDFHRMYSKYASDEDTVEGEMQITADLLLEAERDFCETVVVPSNHDRHLERWLNEADFRVDLVNAKYFCWLQYNLLNSLDDDEPFNLLAFALRDTLRCPETVRFLDRNDSFVICRDASSGGVECALHGDEGPNGARGNTRTLTKLARPVNKGHDHSAAIRIDVYSAGACSLRFPYMNGPSSHTISHIVTFENGTRQIVTMWEGAIRA